MLVVDTGPLVATADTSDKDHAACRALLEGDEGPLVTTAMVIAEAAYLIDRQLGPRAEASLYDSVLSGQLEVASLDREDWQRIAELVTTYADLRLGGTDASVIQVSELGDNQFQCTTRYNGQSVHWQVMKKNREVGTASAAVLGSDW